MMATADIWIAILAGALVCLGAGVAIRLSLSPLLRVLRRMPPGIRAIGLVGLLVAPLGLGLAKAVVVASSSQGGLFDLIHHHCHVEAQGCIAHPPLSAPGHLVALAVAVAAVAAIVVIGACLLSLRRAGTAQRMLTAASHTADASDTRILSTDKAVALACGVFRPMVFISRGLRASLTEDELEIVTRHEHAHVSRFDTLSRMVAASVSLIGHAPRSRQCLQAELVLAQEQACDQAAAEAFGPIRAAETLLKVERLQAGQVEAQAFAAAYVDAPITARVRALVEPRFLSAGRSTIVLAVMALVGVLGVLLGSEPLHHEIETYFFNLGH